MKTIIAVVVYDRIENIKKWIRCWKQCEKPNAELVIIHNYYGNENELNRFKNLCDSNQIYYVPRNGHGYDIGALQQVCADTLPGFPEYDVMIWCTDDTFPMAKDFVKKFTDKLINGVGVVCMEISPEIKLHIRTTGFAIRKEVAKRLTFPANTVLTKDDCYEFEHRSHNSFYNQIKKMGLKVIMPEVPAKSPLWDSMYLKNLPRQKEHDEAFPKTNKVVFVCPIFDAFPEIISSLICQTHKDWELLLICDNPENSTTESIIKATNDNRIKYIKMPRVEKWGHPLRRWALNEIKIGKLAMDADYIVITNGDNYHVPIFCEYMVRGFDLQPNAVASFCTSMVHSYIQHGVIQCRLERGYLDCAGVMVKKDIAATVGWNDVDSHSADWTYFEEIINKYGKQNFVPVNGCLLVHN